MTGRADGRIRPFSGGLNLSPPAPRRRRPGRPDRRRRTCPPSSPARRTGGPPTLAGRRLGAGGEWFRPPENGLIRPSARPVITSLFSTNAPHGHFVRIRSIAPYLLLSNHLVGSVRESHAGSGIHG